MGQTVLTYQFVAGLKPELRLKVAGNDGMFEQLLMRARLEEAKLRDLQPDSGATKQTMERNQQRKLIQGTPGGTGRFVKPLSSLLFLPPQSLS